MKKAFDCSCGYLVFRLFVLVLLPLSLTARNFDRSLQRSSSGEKEKLRIISYNVFNGFKGMADKDRMGRFSHWMKEASPDILALQELSNFSTQDLLTFAKGWGHSYAALVKERKGHPSGIPSQYPIEVKSRILDGFWHGLLHVRIREFDILITHLSPFEVKTRQDEVRRIIEYARTIKNEKILLMGDFNSTSPFDADWLESRMPDRWFDYSVISALLAVPFYDLCYRYVQPEKRGSVPTQILEHVSRNPYVVAKYSKRLDYIFGTKAMSDLTVDGFILNGEDNDYLSDHYPVGVEIFYKPSVDNTKSK